MHKQRATFASRSGKRFDFQPFSRPSGSISYGNPRGRSVSHKLVNL